MKIKINPNPLSLVQYFPTRLQIITIFCFNSSIICPLHYGKSLGNAILLMFTIVSATNPHLVPQAIQWPFLQASCCIGITILATVPLIWQAVNKDWQGIDQDNRLSKHCVSQGAFDTSPTHPLSVVNFIENLLSLLRSLLIHLPHMEHSQVFPFESIALPHWLPRI